MNELIDRYQRRFRYLRLSIIDACNFRCSYCLPNGYCFDSKAEKPLRLDEIRNLVSAFAGLGVEKVRVSGGEPTLRRDLLPILAGIAEVPGIRTLALSTNGYRLKTLAPELKTHGCQAVNVSLDSLNSERFAKVTGERGNHAVLEGIESALIEGLRVKINAVLMRGVNDRELPDFLDYVRTRDCSVRFIELMRTGDNREFFEEHHLRADSLSAELEQGGWMRLPRDATGGPADEYWHPDYRGRIGFIKPYAKNFCDSCNRLRVSCRGELKLCLFGNGQESLRGLLQDPAQEEELQRAVVARLAMKKVSHYLLENDFGNTRALANIGG